MQILIGDYILLEDYFMVQTVANAILRDKTELDQLYSSSVDHIFYVFQKCCHRALITSNSNAISAVINITKNIFRDYKDVNLILIIQTNLKQRSIKNSKPNNSQSLEKKMRQQKPPIPFPICLNNLELSTRYLLQLKQQIESQTSKTRISVSDLRLKTCLEELGDSVFLVKKSLETNLDAFAVSIFKNFEKYLLMLDQVSYAISESHFHEREVNDPFMQQFIRHIDPILKSHSVRASLNHSR